MLKITNLNIKYGNHQVLMAEQFKVPNVGLSIIYGESGSGKTSLLKSILLEEHQFDQYSYNGKVIRKKNMEKFRNEHISSLSQSSILIEDLKVKDHFKLFQKNSTYIKRLKLNKLLDKYPSQLSGGEKTRVGLVLAMMQNKPMLVLDEPTASLDSEMASVVIHLIKEYATNHLVIVSTHDRNMLAVADCIYHIQDKKLILDQYEEKDGKAKPTSHFKLGLKTKLQLFHNLNKRKRVSHILMQLLLIVSIAFTSFGLSIIVSKGNTDNTLDHLVGTDIIVYKQIDEEIAPSFSMDANEYPFTKSEVDSLKNIDNVVGVEPFICMMMTGNIVLPEIVKNNFETRWDFSVIDENKNVVYSGKCPDDEVGAGVTFMGTYITGHDYEEYIKVQNDIKEGIYISADFAKLMHIDETKINQLSLRFKLPIPQYIGYNDALMPFLEEITKDEDGNNIYHYGSDGIPVCRVFGPVEEITIPIAGILKYSNMGLLVPPTEYAIYLPISTLEQKIEEYRTTEPIEYYYDEEAWHYQRLEEGMTPDTRIMHCETYAPNAYIVTADSSSHKKEVIDDIEALGFTIAASRSEILVDLFANNMEMNVFLIAIVSFILVAIIYFVMKYLNLKNEKQFIAFFEQLGWSSKASRNIALQKYLLESVLLTIFTLLFAYIYFRISLSIQFYITSARESYRFIIIALALLISFVYPTVLLCLKGENKER